jgi:hypothetical protein
MTALGSFMLLTFCACGISAVLVFEIYIKVRASIVKEMLAVIFGILCAMPFFIGAWNGIFYGTDWIIGVPYSRRGRDPEFYILMLLILTCFIYWIAVKEIRKEG